MRLLVAAATGLIALGAIFRMVILPIYRAVRWTRRRLDLLAERTGRLDQLGQVRLEVNTLAGSVLQLAMGWDEERSDLAAKILDQGEDLNQLRRQLEAHGTELLSLWSTLKSAGITDRRKPNDHETP